MTMARNEASGLWGDCGYDDEWQTRRRSAGRQRCRFVVRGIARWPQRSRQCHTFAQSHRIRLTRWAPQRFHGLSVFRLSSCDALRGVRCNDALREDRPGQDHQGAGIRTPLVQMLDLLCSRTASGIHPAEAISTDPAPPRAPTMKSVAKPSRAVLAELAAWALAIGKLRRRQDRGS